MVVAVVAVVGVLLLGVAAVVEVTTICYQKNYCRSLKTVTGDCKSNSSESLLE